jgi:hypothetical protein
MSSTQTEGERLSESSRCNRLFAIANLMFARRFVQCDRELPCANCKFRGKESACRYDAAAPTMRGAPSGQSPHGSHRESGATVAAPSLGGSLGESPKDMPERQTPVRTPGRTPVPSEPLLSEAAARWGYSQSKESLNTASMLSEIEARDEESGHGLTSRITIDHYLQPVAKVRERYKSLIRQLPARVFIDKLVDIYFNEFNWQYPVLDRQLFLRQASEWNKVPFHVFQTTGPQELAPELRAFPALLFQIMATALLVVPNQPSSDFDALKYAASMAFDDLALDYSESGADILSTLGKGDVTFTTVQAGFLRAGFLKYTAQVIPSVWRLRTSFGAWHSVADWP